MLQNNNQCIKLVGTRIKTSPLTLVKYNILYSLYIQVKCTTCPLTREYVYIKINQKRVLYEQHLNPTNQRRLLR